MIDPNIALQAGQGQQSPFGGNPLQMMMQIRQMQQQKQGMEAQRQAQAGQQAIAQQQLAALRGAPPQAPARPAMPFPGAGQPQGQGLPSWMLTGAPQGNALMSAAQPPQAPQGWDPMQGPPPPRPPGLGMPAGRMTPGEVQGAAPQGDFPASGQHTALADAHPEYGALDQLWAQAVHAGDLQTAKQINDVMIAMARNGQWKTQEGTANG